MSDDEAAIPEKIRVPDPVSSSESSEKEEDEKEKIKPVNGRSLPAPWQGSSRGLCKSSPICSSNDGYSLVLI